MVPPYLLLIYWVLHPDTVVRDFFPCSFLAFARNQGVIFPSSHIPTEYYKWSKLQEKNARVVRRFNIMFYNYFMKCFSIMFCKCETAGNAAPCRRLSDITVNSTVWCVALLSKLDSIRFQTKTSFLPITS